MVCRVEVNSYKTTEVNYRSKLCISTKSFYQKMPIKLILQCIGLTTTLTIEGISVSRTVAIVSQCLIL